MTTASFDGGRQIEAVSRIGRLVRGRRVLWPVAGLLGSWLGYFALVFGLPVSYPSGNFVAAVSVLALFVIATMVVAVLVDDGVALWLRRTQCHHRVRCLSGKEVAYLIVTALTLSGLGVICAAYDRVAIQGIDYSQGIGAARYLWISAGEERESVSSLYSILGYAFGFTFFAAAALAHLHWEILSRHVKRLAVIGTAVSLAVNSFLSGNRSTVLLLGIVLLSTGIVRKMQGRKLIPGPALAGLIRVAIVSLVAFSYGIYVFSARASAGGQEALAYVDTFLPFLTAEPTPALQSLEKLPDELAATAALGVMAGVYIAHSAGALGEVMTARERPGQGSFAFLRLLLSKLGVTRRQEEERLLEGRLLTMPGGIYYDFGAVGVLAAAGLLGAGLALVSFAVCRHWGGGLALAGTLAVMVTVLATPVALSFDMLAFPFMLLGFAVLHCAHRVRFPKASWWGSAVLLAPRE